MDSLFHLVFAFIAGMAINPKLKHEPLMVLAVSFSAVAIDIDHVIFSYSRTFHNLFVTLLVPLLLFYAAYRYEKGRDSLKYQSLSLLLLAMLNGHLIADLFSGGTLKILYPLSAQDFSIPASTKIAFFRDNWFVVAPEGVALAIYGLIIGAAYYAEEFIYFFEEQHESLEKSLKDSLSA